MQRGLEFDTVACGNKPFDAVGIAFLTISFGAQQFLNGNAVDFCQLQDVLPTRQIAGTLPIHQRRSRNPAPFGNLFLGQLFFPAQKMQPGTVGIATSFWFPTHTRARISAAWS